MDYKELIKSDKISSRQIVDLLLNSNEQIYINKTPLKIPDSIFKYRKFDQYWKESINGITFFSEASKFNKNDNNDSAVHVDIKKLRNLLTEKFPNNNNNPQTKRKISNMLEEYISKIRDNFRIGCFTTVKPTENYMWNKKDFGDRNKGFCIEYETNPSILFPYATIFLPVLYEHTPCFLTSEVAEIIKYDGNITSESRCIATAYNFVLTKNIKYSSEKEWRIIVTDNNYKNYFDIDNCKKDLSQLIKAIYLGWDYKASDASGEKERYILNFCQKNKIPLYKMHKQNDGFESLYTPIY